MRTKARRSLAAPRQRRRRSGSPGEWSSAARPVAAPCVWHHPRRRAGRGGLLRAPRSPRSRPACASSSCVRRRSMRTCWRTVGREMARRCQAVGAKLLVNGDADFAGSIGADGVHLSAARLMSLTSASGDRALRGLVPRSRRARARCRPRCRFRGARTRASDAHARRHDDARLGAIRASGRELPTSGVRPGRHTSGGARRRVVPRCSRHRDDAGRVAGRRAGDAMRLASWLLVAALAALSATDVTEPVTVRSSRTAPTRWRVVASSWTGGTLRLRFSQPPRAMRPFVMEVDAPRAVAVAADFTMPGMDMLPNRYDLARRPDGHW